MKRFFLALSLLTSFPVRLKDAPQPGDSGRSAGWYPLIGALIGAAAAAVYWGAAQVFPPLLAALLSTAAWIALTGGLHLDGLADCCDGLLHASSPERRLEIMKDPRLGTFGGVGFCLAILLKMACLAALPPARVWIALPLAAAAGRWLLLPAARQPMARPGGMGADFALGLSGFAFLPASLTVLPFIALAGWPGAAAFLLAALAAWLIIRMAKSRLGGLTGDVMGLLVEAGELVVLLTLCVKI
jgi:adenosylcobinamide-GDP ribazoletransferase